MYGAIYPSEMPTSCERSVYQGFCNDGEGNAAPRTAPHAEMRRRNARARPKHMPTDIGYQIQK